MTSETGKTRCAVPAGDVIPVLTIERLEDAVPLARALVAGGVRVLEVTLRTPVAIEPQKRSWPMCRRPWSGSAPS